MYSNGVGPQVLSTLVTALPLQDNTKYQYGNTKIFRKHQNVSFGKGERGGSVVECRTPKREVGGSIPTAAVLCP